MSVHPKRVLFVCIGNACRSQMAEAFANAYGADVLVAASAGLAPAPRVAPDTVRAMAEKSIDLRYCFPKAYRQFAKAEFDLVVNLSGAGLPARAGARVIEWDVEDPILMPYAGHCEIRDRIERLTMDLILELRREGRQPHFRSLHTGH